MPEYSNTLIFNTVAERLRSDKPLKAVGEVALTGVGFFHPPLERLYRTTRKTLSGDESLPLQPSTENVANAVSELLTTNEPISTPGLSTVQLTRFVNTLVQFSDRSSVAEVMTTPYSHIQRLHEDIVHKAEVDGPIDYSDQLAIALSHTEHLPSALWNLLIANRQYARWRDADIIIGFPELDKHEKLRQMITWEKSLAAVKDRDIHGFQDSAGDSYYVWTHALARVIYSALPHDKTVVSRAYAKAFEYGSYAMSASAALGKVSVFGTMSNHIPASRYGNAIGEVTARYVEEVNEMS
jgi:hypothetical protein